MMNEIIISKEKELDFIEVLIVNGWIQISSESIYALESNKIEYQKFELRLTVWDNYTVDYLRVEGDEIELNSFEKILINSPKI